VLNTWVGGVYQFRFMGFTQILHSKICFLANSINASRKFFCKYYEENKINCDNISKPKIFIMHIDPSLPSAPEKKEILTLCSLFFFLNVFNLKHFFLFPRGT